MRRPLWLLFLLLGLPALAAWAGEETVYSSAGVSSRWLNVPGSARVASLGGAFAARGQEPGGLEVNPAALAGLEGWQILFTHNAWVQGMAVERLIGAAHLGCWGVAAVELDSLNLGSLERTSLDVPNQPVALGSVGVGSLAGALSWAGIYGPLAAGATLRAEREQLVDSADGYADADLGLGWTLAEGWRVGLALRNVSFAGGDTQRPMAWKLGAGKTFDWERPLALDLNADLQPGDAEPPLWRLGVEWAAARYLALRGGWVAGNARQPHGPSLGAGWLTPYGDIDYALMDTGATGLAHLVTLRLTGWRGL